MLDDELGPEIVEGCGWWEMGEGRLSHVRCTNTFFSCNARVLVAIHTHIYTQIFFNIHTCMDDIHVQFSYYTVDPRCESCSTDGPEGGKENRSGTCACIYVCTHTYMCMYVCMCVCIHVYIRMYQVYMWLSFYTPLREVEAEVVGAAAIEVEVVALLCR